jgi:hypothetical protein
MSSNVVSGGGDSIGGSDGIVTGAAGGSSIDNGLRYSVPGSAIDTADDESGAIAGSGVIVGNGTVGSGNVGSGTGGISTVG